MRARRPVLVLAALALLAGCAQPLPVPDPDAPPAAVPPALAPSQVDRVLADVSAVLAEADAAALAAPTAADPAAARQAAVAALAPRVTGPALTLRTAQYAVAGTAGAAALTSIPAQAQTVVDPAAETWPRVMMTVSEVPEDLRAPLLLTYVQAGPREPYRLTSWQRLFGGVQLPATTVPEIGSPVVAEDEGSVAVPPAEVVARYVDVLTQGAASPHVAAFTEDPLRTRIAEQKAAWQAAVGRGTLTETYVALEDGPWAMATADGGAIVVGGFQTATTLTLVESTLKLSDATPALLGTDTITQTLTLTWLATVAFAVPPAGSTDPVTVLGAEYQLVQATGQ